MKKNITYLFFIFRAFEWELPTFGHLPQVTNLDGKKLSKRQKDFQIEVLREKGYSPGAVLNFMRLAGAGFEDITYDELYYMPDLIKKVSFHLCRVAQLV